MSTGFVDIHKKLSSIEKESIEILSLYKNLTKDRSDIDAKIDAEEKCVEYIKKRFNIVSIHGNESEAWAKIDNVYKDIGRTIIDEYLRKIFNGLYSKHIFSKIITKTLASSYLYQDEFFSNIDVYQIPLLNGVYDLKQNKLIKYSQCDKFFFNKIHIKYNKNAKCPKFINFLNEVLKNGESDVDMMQEAVGNILIGDYRYQKAIIIMGKGGNGKGVFADVLQTVFNGVTSSLDLSQITKKAGDNFELVTLFGKWLNISGDIGKKDFLADTGTFKKLTGEDYIEAQRKNKSNIMFKNRAKLLISCNELPYTSDSSDGFFRRWLYFEFDKTFEDDALFESNGTEIDINTLSTRKKNINLKKELTTPAELEGILKWMIDGAIRLLKNNKFSESETQKQIRTIWKKNSDPLGSFIDSEIDLNENGYIIKKDFKDRLHKYNPSVRVDDGKIKHYLKTELNVFSTKKSINGKRVNIWKGISFIDDHTEVTADIFNED